MFFSRTNTLLEKVASAVEQSAFYSALWGSILTSPAVRLPGVTFVLLHLNRKLSMEDQLYVMGSDIELMVWELVYHANRNVRNVCATPRNDVNSAGGSLNNLIFLNVSSLLKISIFI